MESIGSSWDGRFDEVRLLNRVTAQNASNRVRINSPRAAFQVALYGDDTEAVSCTVVLRKSLDGNAYSLASTFVLSGTGADSVPAEVATQPLHSPYPYWEIEVTAISGTGAGVDAHAVAERE